MEKYVVQTYKGEEIRSLREENGRELFSVVDVLRALKISANPSRYWSDLKRKIRQQEGEAFSITNIVSLKLPAADQKSYKTDMIDAEGLELLLPRLRNVKAEEFLNWLSRTEEEKLPEGNAQKIWPVLPLLNTSFLPGKARETVEKFEDPDLRRIARRSSIIFPGKQKNVTRSRKPIWNMRMFLSGFPPA